MNESGKYVINNVSTAFILQHIWVIKVQLHQNKDTFYTRHWHSTRMVPHFNPILCSTTGFTIETKGRRTGITSGPGTIKARIDRSRWRNRAIITGVGNSHCFPLLREDSTPSLRDHLATREGEGQRPAVKRRCTCIGNHHVRREPT